MALAWLAVVKAGLIAVATMPLLRARELGDIIDKAQPTRGPVRHQAAGRTGTRAQRTGPCCATVDPLQHLERARFAGGARRRRRPAASRACPTAADDIAMMAFTSGTTGKPKAAVHTHRDVLAACEAWPRHVLRATPDDIVVGSPPLAFTFGLGGLLMFPMWAGASVYFPDAPYTPETLVRTINESGRHDLLHRADLLPADGAACAPASASASCASASAPARACPTPRASCGSRRAASR